jgi:stage III sporulation protein AG
VYSSTSGGEPYVVKEIEPEVEGILVVAEGAGNETVVNEITYAVQVLFDVPVHKIKVVKMSSR